MAHVPQHNTVLILKEPLSYRRLPTKAHQSCEQAFVRASLTSGSLWYIPLVV